MIITFGGWYQRTTLHLTEVYEYFMTGKSRLNLSEESLTAHFKKLNLKQVTRELGNLEYVHAFTNDGIEIRYYEDGLYVFQIESTDIKKSGDTLKKYYEESFKPAIEYIFSLGAPTPKILSNIKSTHPIVVSISKKDQKIDISQYGKVYSQNSSKEMSVYKTEEYIFIIPNAKRRTSDFVETQIFFREFKDQLHKYLNIHRKIWEEIAVIKEKDSIRGKEVIIYRAKLESYKKTIDLINYRINQMQSYAKTRASISKSLDLEKSLIEIYQYRFEDLFNTLAYIKEIWAMTANYVNSAISVLNEISNKASMSGIRSIQVLASIGVLAGIINYLKTDTTPKLTSIGAVYLVALLASALLIDFGIKLFFKHKKYKINITELTKDI